MPRVLKKRTRLFWASVFTEMVYCGPSSSIAIATRIQIEPSKLHRGLSFEKSGLQTAFPEKFPKIHM
eukprot:m.134524 g.134524  ORF g.134524 m.134524 type:complete len:67 (+) comp29743_c2_seq1:476-676(+)